MRNPEGTCSREPGAEEVSEARDEKGRGDVEGSTVRDGLAECIWGGEAG